MTSCCAGHVGTFARVVKDNLGWPLRAIGKTVIDPKAPDVCNR